MSTYLVECPVHVLWPMYHGETSSIIIWVIFRHSSVCVECLRALPLVCLKYKSHLPPSLPSTRDAHRSCQDLSPLGVSLAPDVREVQKIHCRAPPRAQGTICATTTSSCSTGTTGICSASCLSPTNTPICLNSSRESFRKGGTNSLWA